MSPGWWEDWPWRRRDAHLFPNSQSQTAKATPVLVIMPTDWAHLWSEIRRWHETSLAPRIRVTIAPPLGPLHFLLDADAEDFHLVFAVTPIVVQGIPIGQVEIGIPRTSGDISLAVREADDWAQAIAGLLSGQSPPQMLRRAG
jgi:hypothetical protein